MEDMSRLDALKKLREPFPAHQIGQLPKGSRAQMQCEAKEKVNCKVCGGWHHPKLVHLSFVGHAALTDKLLDVDPLWSWEPLAFTPEGLPQFDSDGGLWGRVTVCGRTMIGYGNAEASQYKEIGSRQKEVIGDLLRNACMRLGCALELWHKGDLHVEEKDAENKTPDIKGKQPETKTVDEWKALFMAAKITTLDGLTKWRVDNKEALYATIPDNVEKQNLRDYLTEFEEKMTFKDSSANKLTMNV